MGFEAYTRDDCGTEVVPECEDEWQQWVSASRTRNWCLQDPLLDWLNLYGEERGFERDPEPDPRTDFQAFIFRQGHAFEAAVVAHIETLEQVCRLEGGAKWTMSLDACRETFEAMARGEPVIHQGVLRNPENRTYGAADLLVRSDVLRRLFPDAISANEAFIGAPGLGASDWHYRVVDIKFTGLKLDRLWHAANGHLPYMAQTFIYNEALARIQGYLPPNSYLLGRGWEKGTHDGRSTSCIDRLAPVFHDRLVRDQPLREIVGEAVEWIRRLRYEGADWDPRIQTCIRELRPNPGNGQNEPWHRAVSQLANEREDVTLAWQVGLPGRELALSAGVERWTDPRFTAALASVKGAYVPVLDRMLAINRDADAPAIWPDRITRTANTWGVSQGIEFYVDFETVSNLNDDFTRIPDQNGQPLIFMIGCGHLEDGEWKFACFIARDLNVESEADIVEDWLEHMESVRTRVASQVESPLVFHWSPAETASFSGLKSARMRSPKRSLEWQEPHWFDFLNEVMKKEPVIVRGPMGFGLKTVARSLKAHELIETEWKDGITDGLGAMVAAWWCADEARCLGCGLGDIELMHDLCSSVEERQDVRTYNEVDCKVMMETVRELRKRVA
jgi:hypothetical protein